MVTGRAVLCDNIIISASGLLIAKSSKQDDVNSAHRWAEVRFGARVIGGEGLVNIPQLLGKNFMNFQIFA